MVGCEPTEGNGQRPIPPRSSPRVLPGRTLLCLLAASPPTESPPLAYALQQLINGITLGMIYGLIAVGYTMVYGIIGMINFAHGDIFMI